MTSRGYSNGGNAYRNSNKMAYGLSATLEIILDTVVYYEKSNKPYKIGYWDAREKLAEEYYENNFRKK